MGEILRAPQRRMDNVVTALHEALARHVESAVRVGGMKMPLIPAIPIGTWRARGNACVPRPPRPPDTPPFFNAGLFAEGHGLKLWTPMHTAWATGGMQPDASPHPGRCLVAKHQNIIV